MEDNESEFGKIVGTRIVDDSWDRHTRMQRTATKVTGGLPYERGKVYRFKTHEEQDAWILEQTIRRQKKLHETRKSRTLSSSAAS